MSRDPEVQGLHQCPECSPPHAAGIGLCLGPGNRWWAQAASCFQVNHSPSFTTDSRLDREVKDALLCDAINLINLRACDKKKVLEEDKRRVKERLLQAHQPPREARYPCESEQCSHPTKEASVARLFHYLDPAAAFAIQAVLSSHHGGKDTQQVQQTG